MVRRAIVIRRAPTTGPSGASLPEMVLRSDQPCLCGSGRTLERCCFNLVSGSFRHKMPNLTPPGPLTGFSHPRCYLQGTADCSKQISGEHIVSGSVMRILGEGELSGAHWLEPSEARKASFRDLRANVLCRRHNSALSPLDDVAGRFFREMDEALIDLDNWTASRKPKFHLFSGEVIERWMLKVACGLYHSIGSKDRQRVRGQFPFNMEKASRALLEGFWEDDAGLYLSGSKGTSFRAKRSVSIAPLSAANRVVGATVGLHGFWFDLVFDADGASKSTWNGRTRRPGEIVIAEHGRTHSFVLTWPPGTRSTVLNLRRVE